MRDLDYKVRQSFITVGSIVEVRYDYIKTLMIVDRVDESEGFIYGECSYTSVAGKDFVKTTRLLSVDSGEHLNIARPVGVDDFETMLELAPRSKIINVTINV